MDVAMKKHFPPQIFGSILNKAMREKGGIPFALTEFRQIKNRRRGKPSLENKKNRVKGARNRAYAILWSAESVD